MLQRWQPSSFISSAFALKEKNDRLFVAAEDLPFATVKILSTSPNVMNDWNDCDVIINEPLSTPSFPLTALLISGGVVGSVMFLTLPFIVMPFVSGQTLPYMATPKRKVLQALKYIQQRHHQTRPHHDTGGKRFMKNRQFLDLGSGDGETVYQALQLLNPSNNPKHLDNQSNIVYKDDHDDTESHYYTKCIGIELNTTLYLWSCWRRMMFWSRSEQLRSQFLCRNMFHQPLPTNHSHHESNHWIRQSDTIMIFGIPSLMMPLSQLLAQHQCRSGTYILSYRFPLPTTDSNHHPDNSSGDNSLLQARLIYDQEEMRIYECTGSNNTTVTNISNEGDVVTKEAR
jgi:hypothetical protein